VLDNLISNACESSAADAAIEVEAHSVPDAVAVSVSDRGIGLAAGEEDAIFEAFRRGIRKERFAPGIGLGLTACRRLVEAMRGTIWAQRREGGGTEVTFVLPAAGE
jgi:two-component system sensor histidine kinase KdpD